MTLPKLIAKFQTTLASSLSDTALTATLTSAFSKNGTVIPNGVYGFTIDEGTLYEEYVIANVVGSAMSGMTRGLSYEDGLTSIPALKKKHRKGATIKITDNPVLQYVLGMLNGTINLDQVMKNPASRIISDSRHLVDLEFLAAYSSSGVSTFMVTKNSALTVNVGAGSYIYEGVQHNYAGASAQAVTDGATNYVQINPSTTALVINTIGFIDSYIPLAVVTAVAGDITSVADRRPFLSNTPPSLTHPPVAQLAGYLTGGNNPSALSVWNALALGANNAKFKAVIDNITYDNVAIDLQVLNDITTATYTGNNKNIETNQSTGITISADGTKLYVTTEVGGGQLVSRYPLSTPYDLSTAGAVDMTYSPTNQQSNPRGVFFKPDGLTMYIIGASPASRIHQYTLSVAWDITTATYASKLFSCNSQDTNANDLFISPDGTKLYVTGNTNATVYQYTLSTPWDISTASYASKSFADGSVASLQGLWLSPTGKQAMINSSSAVYQVNLATAWDISTAVYAGKTFSLASQDNGVGGICFNPDGSKLYIAGDASDKMYQYALTTSWLLTSLNAVAALVQAAIRALTAKTETVVFSGGRFIVTSSVAGRTGIVLKFLTPTTGTDISGRNATLYLDLGTNATETPGTGSELLYVRTDSNGKIEASLLSTSVPLPAIDASALLNLSVNVSQKIPYFTGTNVTEASEARYAASPDGSELFISRRTTSSIIKITRLQRDSITGQYRATHEATFTDVSGGAFTSGSNGMAVLGNYVYIWGKMTSPTSAPVRRYDKADLGNVTTITISGSVFGNGQAGITDGTNLWILDSSEVYRKYTISGTVMTDSGTTITLTNCGNNNGWSDGTYIWTLYTNGNAITIKKYSVAGGAALTTKDSIHYTSYPNASARNVWLARPGVVGIGYSKTNESNSAVVGVEAVIDYMPLV